ncbi:hypothetical protein ABIB42_003000 [Massilia sp. UYP32]|uniref:ATP-binding protein n=1 Tax=Massilia TaxID=149698 RepID=UPI001E5466FD|nr:MULTISPECIES: ATP-binding protein [Massilia]
MSACRALRPAHMPLLAAMLCALPALAEPGAGTASPSSWALGVGAITFDKAYAGIEREHLPLPFVPYENRWLSIAGPQVGFKLLELAPAPAHTLNLDLVVRYDGSGDDDIEDTPVLAGERKSGAWAGARIEWKSNRAVLGAEALGAPAGSLVSVEIARDSLSVRDHGPGVEAAQLALLFERFWRGPHRRNLGAGLGLSICQEVARAHGWRPAERVEPGLRFRLAVAP